MVDLPLKDKPSSSMTFHPSQHWKNGWIEGEDNYYHQIVSVATLTLGSRPRQGVARKPGSQKEGSPGTMAKALEGCGPRGGSPGVITYSRESKEVRGSVRE